MTNLRIANREFFPRPRVSLEGYDVGDISYTPRQSLPYILATPSSYVNLQSRKYHEQPGKESDS